MRKIVISDAELSILPGNCASGERLSIMDEFYCYPRSRL